MIKIKNRNYRWNRHPGWNYPTRLDYKKRVKIGKASEYDYLLEGLETEVAKNPIVLNKWQKQLREKYAEEVLNPSLPQNAVAVIYTDGSMIHTQRYSSERIEFGGYAAILIIRAVSYAEIMISGRKRRPSSSEYMELLAIYKALKRLRKYRITGEVVLYCDSLGLVNKFNTKLADWEKCGWKANDGKYIRNWRLWKKIWKKSKKLDLRVCWVKGHAESKYNKRCDFVACAEATLGAMAY